MNRCPTKGCPGKPKPERISATYTRKGSATEVTVEGIPADVCPVCGQEYLDLKTVEELEELLKPLFEFGRVLHKNLSSPRVKIKFLEKVPA